MGRAFPPSSALAALASLGLAVGCSPSVEGGLGKASSELSDGTESLLLSERAVARLLADAGFLATTVPKMVCVARHESGLDAYAAQRAANGAFRLGLFQINTVHVGHTPGCPNQAERLYDAATNAKCALGVYRVEGLRAWPAYAANKAECDAARGVP